MAKKKKIKGKLNRQFPKLAKEFHPTLNGNVFTKDVDVDTKKIYWWKCTKKYCQADFKGTVKQRVRGDVVCPTCQERDLKRKINKTMKDPLFQQWLELETMFGEIDSNFVEFMDEDNSKTKKLKEGLAARKKISAIENYMKNFRKITMKIETKEEE